MERTSMPIARRRRANPPEQPENNNHLADQLETATEALATEQSAESSQGVERQEQNQGQVVQNQPGQPAPVATPQASFHSFALGQSPPALQASSTTPVSQPSQVPPFPPVSQGSQVVPASQVPQTPVINGERIERQDYASASTPGF